MIIKQRIRIAIDILMTLSLFLLMGYQFWGDVAHEWIGTAMFVLYVAHHKLNIGWYKSLFNGKYPPMCILQNAINMLLFVAMLMQMYSGITMSKHVFTFLPIEGGMMRARQLHILSSFWGFVLMSAHLGLHWNRVLHMLLKTRFFKSYKGTFLKYIGFFIAAYGLIAFIKRDLLTYLFLRSEFVFMDYSEPILLFYLDYIAMMGLFVFLAYTISKLLKNKTKRKHDEK